MVRGFLKTAALGAALVAMPVSAVANTSASVLSVAQSQPAGESSDNENGTGRVEGLVAYAIPIAIVIVIALALYFALDDGDEDTGISV